MQEHVQTLAEVIREARARVYRCGSWRGGAASRLRRSAGSRRARSNDPVAETLVRLAKALGRDAQLLLVRGAYSGDERTAAPATGDRGAARAEQSRAHPCSSRLDAESERERRLRDELADAERALTGIQEDLDATRERVSAEPPREARKRLREVGMLAQRRAVEVAQKRRQLEQLEDAPSEENCALAGRLFLDTAAGGEVLEAWRQFSGQDHA